MVKTLGEVVDEIFQQVGIPEILKRPIPASADVLRAIGPPEGWAASEVGYAAPFETSGHWSQVWRIGRAWQEGPPAVEFGSLAGHSHQFPYGAVGSYNIGLPPAPAGYLQMLREGSVDPADPSHITTFQKNMAQLLEISLPLLLAKVMRDTPLADAMLTYTPSDERFHQPAEPRHYEEFWSGHKGSYECSDITTQSGSRSLAITTFPLIEQSLIGHSRELAGAIPEISFIAIHRAGILPSLMGQHIAGLLGMRSYVVGVEAKRQHDDEGITAVLSAPYGYQAGAISTYAQGFLFPDGFPFNGQLGGRKIRHIIFDPMLATGKSAEAVIREYQKATYAPSSDITVMGLFAGGYEGIQRLRELGVNILILQHDQADLNSSGYIQPGLGDAGDKLCGYERDTRVILQGLSHLAEHRPGLGKLFDAYARQVTGKGISLG